MTTHRANIRNARRCRLASRSSSKKRKRSPRESDGVLGVTPYEILTSWLRIRYGISELEFIFGSNDFGFKGVLSLRAPTFSKPYSKAPCLSKPI